MHTHGCRESQWVSCSSTLCLCPLRQSFSQTLELGWEPASPISLLFLHRITGIVCRQAQPHPAVTWIRTQTLTLCSKNSDPLTPPLSSQSFSHLKKKKSVCKSAAHGAARLWHTLCVLSSHCSQFWSDVSEVAALPTVICRVTPNRLVFVPEDKLKCSWKLETQRPGAVKAVLEEKNKSWTPAYSLDINMSTIDRTLSQSSANRPWERNSGLRNRPTRPHHTNRK